MKVMSRTKTTNVNLPGWCGNTRTCELNNKFLCMGRDTEINNCSDVSEHLLIN